MTAVGLIGLGLLGSAIADRLIADGHQVTGFDINPERRTAHLDRGGRLADDVLELCRSHKILMLSLPDSRIVADVLGPVMNELHGHLIVDTTTGAPQDVRTLAAKLASQDSELVDATVVGSSEQARSAEATVIAGGSESAFQSALPLLKCFSQQQFHVGPSGSGATAKLIVNLVLGLNRAVLAEALNLTQQSGMDPRALLEILRSGAAYSKVMDIKGEKMVTQDFTPQARLDQHWKDVRLILDLGQATGSRLPLSQLHAQLLERASSLGFGQLDNSAIIKAFETAPENDAAS